MMKIRKLRQVKSEIPVKFIKRVIKTYKTKTPLRCSRRIRHLPPEDIDFADKPRYNMKKEPIGGKNIISQESSIQFSHDKKTTRMKKLRYPLRAKNSKEVVSILSAPKIWNRRSLAKKSVASKFRISIKKEPTQEAEQILKTRKKYVLELLNKGNTKEIEKLPTVGTKTAEMIILYRQLRGSINRISELAEMPKFPKRRFHNFVAQNFLRAD